MKKKKDWICSKVLPVSDYCDFCKHNGKDTETHTTLYCPITGIDPNKEKCTNADDVQGSDEAGIS